MVFKFRSEGGTLCSAQQLTANNNNRLFTAPHLQRAQITYNDIRIHTHTHTHTHSHTYTLLTAGWQNEKKENGRSVCRREEVGFQFWLKKEESEDECLMERGREFQIAGPMYWKDLSPNVLLPILGKRNIPVSKDEQRNEKVSWEEQKEGTSRDSQLPSRTQHSPQRYICPVHFSSSSQMLSKLKL